MAAEKGSKKKPGKKKPKKKRITKKKYKDPAKLRKRPKWIRASDWKKALAPPQGTGHIDRFYFSNCSTDAQVIDILAVVVPEGGGALAFLSHGPVNPLENGLLVMPYTFESVEVIVSALVEDGGAIFQYDYLCQIPASFSEHINSLVVGIAKFVRGLYWETRPFGEVFGHLGTNYQVPQSDMNVTQLWP